MEGFKLVKPSADYLDEIRAYRKEFDGCLDWMHGSGGLMNIEDAEKWLEHLRLCENQETVPDGKPASSQFIYVRESDGKIVGMINVRHWHIEPLSTFGGHVGYSVCPSERKKGYATAMLKEVLPHCREIGLENVLLTVGLENTGSRRTILANGGVYEGTVISPKHNIPVERYWINIK